MDPVSPMSAASATVLPPGAAHMSTTRDPAAGATTCRRTHPRLSPHAHPRSILPVTPPPSPGQFRLSPHPHPPVIPACHHTPIPRSSQAAAFLATEVVPDLQGQSAIRLAEVDVRVASSSISWKTAGLSPHVRAARDSLACLHLIPTWQCMAGPSCRRTFCPRPRCENVCEEAQLEAARAASDANDRTLRCAAVLLRSGLASVVDAISHSCMHSPGLRRCWVGSAPSSPPAAPLCTRWAPQAGCSSTPASPLQQSSSAGTNNVKPKAARRLARDQAASMSRHRFCIYSLHILFAFMICIIRCVPTADAASEQR